MPIVRPCSYIVTEAIEAESRIYRIVGQTSTSSRKRTFGIVAVQISVQDERRPDSRRQRGRTYRRGTQTVTAAWFWYTNRV